MFRTAPPENRLNMPKMPPLARSNIRANSSVLTPGIGMKVPRRYTMSAPRVNHRRLCSSVAFWKAPKFRLAASCSAAEAMGLP